MLNGEEWPFVLKLYISETKVFRPSETIASYEAGGRNTKKSKTAYAINIKQLVDAKTGQERSDFRLGDYSTVISAAVKAK